jgi:ankyrin repeat protein
MFLEMGANVAAVSLPWGSKINRKLHGGRTALYWAAETGDERLVQLLFDRGAKVAAVYSSLRTLL